MSHNQSLFPETEIHCLYLVEVLKNKNADLHNALKAALSGENHFLRLLYRGQADKHKLPTHDFFLMRGYLDQCCTNAQYTQLCKKIYVPKIGYSPQSVEKDAHRIEQLRERLEEEIPKFDVNEALYHHRSQHLKEAKKCLDQDYDTRAMGHIYMAFTFATYLEEPLQFDELIPITSQGLTLQKCLETYEYFELD
jgi:exonuclease VII small subunit